MECKSRIESCVTSLGGICHDADLLLFVLVLVLGLLVVLVGSIHGQRRKMSKCCIKLRMAVPSMRFLGRTSIGLVQTRVNVARFVRRFSREAWSADASS